MGSAQSAPPPRDTTVEAPAVPLPDAPLSSPATEPPLAGSEQRLGAPEAGAGDAVRDAVHTLRAYVAPASVWIGGFVGLAALGWIFGYDDLAKDYPSQEDKVQLAVSLWFMAVALLVTSFSTGLTAYAWHREKAVSDDNEDRFNLYVALALLGPPLALWLVIARRDVMF
ncbi:hypothetical protein [Nonomuraea sp. NPDC049684]|uniref:hypothetical protein n=1 Tax=Nonomuraea sp. NPDC049684 TaxID=3364356 RepID=UPI0037B265E1